MHGEIMKLTISVVKNNSVVYKKRIHYKVYSFIIAVVKRKKIPSFARLLWATEHREPLI